MVEEYSTTINMQIHIIYRKQLFFSVLVYLTICMILALFQVFYFKNRVVGIIILSLMLLPVIFIKFLITKSTRLMVINLHPDYFETKILSKNIIENKIAFSGLKSYSIQLPNDRFSSIKFREKNKKTIEFSFFKSKKHEDEIADVQIFDLFHEKIANYNAAKEPEEKIYYTPAFYATKKGLYSIIGLGFFLGVGFFLYALSSNKPFPFEFLLSFILILHLIMRRKRELEYFKRTINRR